jgi:hypothetical protein
MGTTAPETELPIATYAAWDKVRKRAADEHIPFHPPWNDFWAFLAELGQCHDGSHLYAMSMNIGFVPGNVYWMGGSKWPNSYEGCPVALGLLKAELIDETVALRLAWIDADVEIVRSAVKELDAATADKERSARAEAFLALVTSLERLHGKVPAGEPNRWQIHNEKAAIKRENRESGRDGDPLKRPRN